MIRKRISVPFFRAPDLRIPFILPCMKHLFSLVFCAVAVYSWGQSPNAVTLEQAKRFLQAEREEIFIQTLRLSVSEASVFHPIFVEYNREKRVLDELLINKFVTYAEGYQSMSPKAMGRFIKETRRVQRKDLNIRKRYYHKLRKEISTEIAVQFYEVDDLLSTSLRLNVLSSLPFLSGQALPSAPKR